MFHFPSNQHPPAIEKSAFGAPAHQKGLHVLFGAGAGTGTILALVKPVKTGKTLAPGND